MDVCGDHASWLNKGLWNRQTLLVQIQMVIYLRKLNATCGYFAPNIFNDNFFIECYYKYPTTCIYYKNVILLQCSVIWSVLWQNLLTSNTFKFTFLYIYNHDNRADYFETLYVEVLGSISLMLTFLICPLTFPNGHKSANIVTFLIKWQQLTWELLNKSLSQWKFQKLSWILAGGYPYSIIYGVYSKWKKRKKLQ